MPVVEMPPKAEQREDYFLTRQQIAERVRAARRKPETRHVARMLLIGFYTGSRPGTILKLGWLPSTTGGWFDLDARILYRKPGRATDTKKRQPKAILHPKLLLLARYWKRRDLARGIVTVVHYQGKPIKTKLRRSWDSVRRAAGQDYLKDGAHVLRHSCATFLMQAGVTPFVAAGYLGMSEETLRKVYGHHHPDFQSEIAHAHVSPKKRVNRTGTQ